MWEKIIFFKFLAFFSHLLPLTRLSELLKLTFISIT